MLKVYLKLPKRRALALWSVRREISNRLMFTLADWEASLLLTGRSRLVRWYQPPTRK